MALDSAVILAEEIPGEERRKEEAVANGVGAREGKGHNMAERKRHRVGDEGLKREKEGKMNGVQ